MTDDSISGLESIGRNEPCPCGSGKKYKKCHYRAHQVEKEARKKTILVEEQVNETTSPLDFYKLLVRVHQENAVSVISDLMHDLSPLRTAYPDAVAYVAAVAAGDERLPAGPDFELLRLRIDGPDVLLLLVSGHDDPTAATVRFQVVVLRPHSLDADRVLRSVNALGYRLWTIDTSPLKKGDLDLEDIGFDRLDDVSWHESWLPPEGWTQKYYSSVLNGDNEAKGEVPAVETEPPDPAVDAPNPDESS